MLNEDLMAYHLETVTADAAVKIYHALCEMGERRPGGLDIATQQLIGAYAMLEQVKISLILDIGQRGVSVDFKNGRQRMIISNKNMPLYRGMVEQQRKLLAEMRFTPASVKAEAVSMELTVAEGDSEVGLSDF